LVELGVLSLGDLQRDQRTGRRHRPVDRMAEILGYAVLVDQLGLDVFAIGEHHSAEFFTSSPAVVLAATAARTARIRLTSATTLLGVADPVRVYEDFASLDVISRGRAEVIVGRSAFAEPFALFGYDTADYDALFAEKLGLLLDIRAAPAVTWSGRFRPRLDAAAVVPRAVYPYYHEYLRPKRPGGRGFVVSQAAFDAGTSRQGAIMIGSAGEITDKLADAVKTLGLDRVFAQVDWGGLPSGLVEESIARYATDIAPALRAA
jgi:hypothetical protein